MKFYHGFQESGNGTEEAFYLRRFQNHSRIPYQAFRDRGIPEQKNHHRLAGQANIGKCPGGKTGCHVGSDIRSAPHPRLPDPGLLPDFPGFSGEVSDPPGQLAEEPC